MALFGIGWGTLFWFEAGIVEAFILGRGLRVPLKQALGISLLANLISSAVGLVFLMGNLKVGNFSAIAVWFWLGVISVEIEVPIWKLSLRSYQVSLDRVIAFCALANLVGYLVILGEGWWIARWLGVSVG